MQFQKNFCYKDSHRTIQKSHRLRTTDDLHPLLVGYSIPQKPPLFLRSFTCSFHSAEDHSSICWTNWRRSNKIWLFQPINASCQSNFPGALSPATEKIFSFHRLPNSDCKNVARRAEIGRLHRRSRPAPYTDAWHLSTFPVPTVLATNRSASPQQQTPRHESYIPSPVLDFEEGGHHVFFEWDSNHYSSLP